MIARLRGMGRGSVVERRGDAPFGLGDVRAGKESYEALAALGDAEGAPLPREGLRQPETLAAQARAGGSRAARPDPPA